jgi:Coenzyme PQQ synthesis protein D (PqqD)
MRFRANSPYVISETIQGETIIIHLTTGTYYSLQGSGAEVWDAIVGGATAAEIAADLSARYGVVAAEAETTVVSLLDDLQAEDLVAAGDAAARETAPTTEPAAGPFVAPTLAKYTDMQDLVLLDPVHEVGDAGWPETKQQVAGA